MARRRGHARHSTFLSRAGTVALVLLACGVVCCGAFIAGRGGF